MTIVEKAAYLKGLTEGLGVDPESRDGKLWGALTELLSDMAHEIEDLQTNNLDLADTLDEVCEDLAYLEDLTCGMDPLPEDLDEDFDDSEDEDGYRFSGEEVTDAEEYDGVLYDVSIPAMVAVSVAAQLAAIPLYLRSAKLHRDGLKGENA